MQEHHLKVKVLDKLLDQALFVEYGHRYDAHLKLAIAYDKGCRDAYCMCTDEPRELLIIDRSDSDVYFLRIKEGDRENHNPQCAIRMKGEGLETYCGVPNFEVDGDNFKVNATINLQDEDGKTGPIPNQNAKNNVKPVNIWKVGGRKKTGLGGLMNFMVSNSELNVWKCGDVRSYSEYMTTICSVSKKIVIRNIALKDRIYIGGTGEHDEKQQGDLFYSSQNDFLEKLKKESQVRGATARGIIFDEITSYEKGNESTVFKFKSRNSSIKVSSYEAESIKRSNAQEWASLGKGGRHVFGMFLVSSGADGQMKIEDAALFLTNQHYFNVESYPEAQLVDKLILENRSFVKPYRQWNDCGFIPDFRLLDTKEDWIIEVWGMTTKKYLEHKEKKIEYYTRIKAKLIEWDVRKYELQCVKFPERNG